MRRRLQAIPAVRQHLAISTAFSVALAIAIVAQADTFATLLAEAAVGKVQLASAAWLLAAVGCRAALSWARQRLALRSARAVTGQLRDAVTENCAALGPVRLTRERSGELVTLLTRGLAGLEPYLSGYLPATVTAAIIPVAVLIRLAVADPTSAAIAAVTLPLVPVFGILVGWHTQARTDRQWRRLSTLGGHFLDVLRGLPTLRMYGRAHAQAAVVRDLADRYRLATMATLRIAFLSALVLEILASLAVALVAVPLGFRLLDGQIALHTALLVLLLVPEAFIAIRAAGGQFHASAEGLAAAKQVFEALDIPVPTSKPAAIIRSAAGIIEFQDVSLRYEENGPYALRDLSLTIQSGERIALTGPSGAGKSSLLALLLRFIEPTSGRITVDGIDLADLDPDRWRTSIGWLPQRPRLFARSVLENIRLGQPSYEQEDVKAAAGKAGAHDFVAKLPDGYDTVLGENGYGLSAGQAQRIALARTFLRTNDLVLLDEPTARLDSVSEAAVLDGINRVSRGRTALLVAHRPAVVAMADRVVRLEAGLCVPIG